MRIRRGDIFLVDLRGAEGHEKLGIRPCLIVQNDTGNRHSPVTLVAPLTDARQDHALPVQVAVTAAELGAANSKDSVIECGQIRAVDAESRLLRKLGHLDVAVMARVDDAIRRSFGLS